MVNYSETQLNYADKWIDNLKIPVFKFCRLKQVTSVKYNNERANKCMPNEKNIKNIEC